MAASLRPSTPSIVLRLSSKKAPTAQAPIPIEVAARYTFWPKWPASIKAYRYERSWYFQRSRCKKAVKTNTKFA